MVPSLNGTAGLDSLIASMKQSPGSRKQVSEVEERYRVATKEYSVPFRLLIVIPYAHYFFVNVKKL